MTLKATLTNYLFILIGLLVIQAVWAQDKDKKNPSKENNIICFAAKKQWVCAPADEQHKAQEKAQKLALEPDQPELIDDGVEIQTLQPVNIGLQARQSNPNATMPYNIQDFTAREEVSSEKQPIPELSEGVVESIASTEPQSTENMSVPVVEHTEVNAISDTGQPTTDVQSFHTAPNDFSYWQTHFATQWTFQVVGTSNRHKLEDFVSNNHLQQHNHVFVRTQREGADWWIVLVGFYSSRDEAISQQYTLPATLANGAWVRQVRTIDGYPD